MLKHHGAVHCVDTVHMQAMGNQTLCSEDRNTRSQCCKSVLRLGSHAMNRAEHWQDATVRSHYFHTSLLERFGEIRVTATKPALSSRTTHCRDEESQSKAMWPKLVYIMHVQAKLALLAWCPDMTRARAPA